MGKLKSSYLALLFCSVVFGQEQPVDYVNPFIGTSNYGATHPGAIAPRGMASVSPFNVAGKIKLNPLEKDSQWLSNPYVHENSYLTGFSHVNLSGVGCPDLGVIISMPTTGKLKTNHLEYGSTYSEEVAKAGYYSVTLDGYNIKTEATASTRVGVSRYTFPAGESNILLNLGLGLTNEQGGMLKINSASEVEGLRMVGSFCYNSPEAAYPVYFVAKLSKPADNFGIWNTPYKNTGKEAQWMGYNARTRIKESFTREVVGDSIGAYFSYNFKEPTKVEVKIGISYVSIENARENLEKEVGKKSFDEVYKDTKEAWNKKLSRIEVEGGTEDKKSIFYTALYHTQIHPNILNDINGEYPEVATGKIGTTNGTRYTVFSLWDTYRNYHQLMSLVYPEEQLQMVNSMLDMYDENGWLPKWELNSTETFTMVGDPASVVIADTYLRGLTGFDVEKAYKAMLKSATQTENNPLRPGLGEYIKNGYLSVDSRIAGPVSTTLEYNISDYAIAQMAKALGKKDDYLEFSKRSLSYKKLYNPETGFLQPKYRNGEWYKPFDPEAGANFTKNVGYIEGNAWQYLFMVPHDIPEMIKLTGDTKNFVKRLDYIFDKSHYDMANEPDIAYPFLYNYSRGDEWKTQKRVDDLLRTYYKNGPYGLPGNDDTGTMSAWAVFAMMGIYPITPAAPVYALSAPKFSKISIHLNNNYYKQETLVFTSNASEGNIYIDSIEIDGKGNKSYFIDHDKLLKDGHIEFKLKATENFR
ncbi:GH92 family glycosyl hydrolase [Gramella sp. AN32]|uniref:GH92 family glycosyl hydrolase n=1 Tax=Christiangramia antarctica TaxID=2058158 RepID=A0ABW5X2N1_9FLAO|nr:GH92 family glycosyl hydrolase [Gramella sp. AN32]MCM4156983.1 alpha-mannosidase [Gramella sp. AN32]